MKNEYSGYIHTHKLIQFMLATRGNTIIPQVTLSKSDLFSVVTESPLRHQEAKLASERYPCCSLKLKKTY